MCLVNSGRDQLANSIRAPVLSVVYLLIPAGSVLSHTDCISYFSWTGSYSLYEQVL